MKDVSHYMRPGMLQLPALPPLSLYVHLPWCLKKCPYCDFNSHEMQSSELPEQRYLDALRADLEAALPLIWGRQVHSIFIGGGTPSLFTPEGIGTLLSDVRARLNLVPECEITLEANPGTFEKDRFKGLPRRRRDAPVGGRAEFRRREAARPGPRARQPAGRRRRWRRPPPASRPSTST
jgi:oxygen-independent coproporphyrinogen-3 oxidase